MSDGEGGGEDEGHHGRTTADKLVYMANQIAAFFRHQPHDAAVAGVADHIKSFWDPAMKRTMYAHLDSGEGGDLVAIAREGIDKLRHEGPGQLHAEAVAAGAPTPGPEPGDDAG